MINTGTCVPTPGLHRQYNVFACCVGVWNPQVLVDPMVRTKRGEQALVAHEMFHAQDRHALKFMVMIVCCSVLTFLAGIIVCAFTYGIPVPPWVAVAAPSMALLWWCQVPFYLRYCEVEADKHALFCTTPGDFVAMLYLHPHPSGRWGRWLYGPNIEARIKRVLPRS